MCLLIDNSSGSVLNSDIVKRAALINSDGYGRLCLRTGKVEKTLDMEKAIKLALEPGPAIHHFRWATVGGKTLQNCHPFPVDNGFYLFQNGTVEGFIDDDRTDTQHLADMLRSVNHESREAVLSRFAQRYVLVNAKRKSIIRTGEGWVEHEGAWYSNAYCIPTGKMVAVYGTLKTGHGNNWMLDKADFMGWGWTNEKHRLCVHGLPFLIEGGGGSQVEVEVYRVSTDTLLELDKLEGHPTLYQRRETQVTLSDGEEVTAWIYFAGEDKDHGNYSYCYGESWGEDPVDMDDMVCPQCESHEVASDQGYLYCEGCGHFTSDINTFEWTKNKDLVN